jgi:hypothetical protein
MNQLISNYKNKYLKYKKKYLDLKYGGSPKYIPPHLRQFEKNYYVNIKEGLLLDLYFKDKLVADLNLAGYNSSSKTDASMVYIYGQDEYPKKNKDESEMTFMKRKIEHQTQFPNVQMINILWGDYKEIITNKVKFHEYFKDNTNIQKYITPWISIKKETRLEDISKIKFSERECYVLKAENGYKSWGTILVKNTQEILEQIEKYDKRYLVSNREHTQVVNTDDWLVENYIKQDTIEGRKFFMRVHILVVFLNGKFNVYISNKHPYSIIKVEAKDEPFLSQGNVDDIEGSHLLKYNGNGGGGSNYKDRGGNSVIYNLDKNAHWPKDLPDGYNDIDKLRINENLNELFTNIFSNDKLRYLKPDFKSPNGFENFGCDVSFENKKVILHEINRRTGLLLQAPFIADIIKIYKHEDDFNNFSKLI